jgi:hypothetical protein
LTRDSFTGDPAATGMLCRLLERACRHVEVASAALDPAIFNRNDVIDLVSAFARSRGSSIRILLTSDASASAITGRGHDLLRLQQRLDSKILLRRSEPGQIAALPSFVLADALHSWRLADDASFTGDLLLDAPVDTRRLLEHFEDAWSQAQTDRSFERLAL